MRGGRGHPPSRCLPTAAGSPMSAVIRAATGSSILRALDQPEARALAGTEGAAFARSCRRTVGGLGFFADGKAKEGSLAGGGPPQLSARPTVTRATWGDRTRSSSSPGGHASIWRATPAGHRALSPVRSRRRARHATTSRSFSRGARRSSFPSGPAAPWATASSRFSPSKRGARSGSLASKAPPRYAGPRVARRVVAGLLLRDDRVAAGGSPSISTGSK